MKSIAMKTLQHMAKTWPMDLLAVLEGEYEEIESSLLLSPQVQEILQSLRVGDSGNLVEDIKDIPSFQLPPPPVKTINSPPIRPMKSPVQIEKELATPVINSPTISPRKVVPSSVIKKQSPCIEFDEIDPSLFELLTTSIPIECRLASSKLFSSTENETIRLLDGCQDDFDAIDRELMKMPQQQEKSHQNSSRNYIELFQNLPNQMAIDDELTSLLSKEIRDISRRSHEVEKMRKYLLSPTLSRYTPLSYLLPISLTYLGMMGMVMAMKMALILN